MDLTSEQTEMADGRQGPVLEFAVQLMIQAGRVQGATRLQAIEAAYVNTTFATTETHYDLLLWLAENKAQVRVPTYTNVGIIDTDNPALRPDDYGQWATARSRELNDLHNKIGCRLTMTCAPYQLPGQPGFGTHIATSESNAVSYFNSVLGVRTLKYGDYLDIAAGLCGLVPYMGYHTDAGRRATLALTVDPLPPAFAGDDLSYQLIGHAMGRKAGMDVPVLVGVNPHASRENLRSVGAAGASAGGVALYHAVGLTPEAGTLEQATGGVAPSRLERISIDDLKAAKQELTHFDSGPIDAVAIGTPHAPLAEVAALASLVEGRRIRPGVAFYIQMNRFVLERAREKGWIDTLVGAGITPVSDTCLYWRPLTQGLQGRVMTNSGKFAYYSPGELNISVSIASLKECVESAVRGEVWHDPAMRLDP